MINVLYILDYGTVGGATKAFVSLMFQLIRYDIKPIVITGVYNELNELLEANGIETIVAGHVTAIEPFKFEGIKWPLRLAKLIIRYYYKEIKAIKIVAKSIDLSEIDIIHTNSARNTLGCRLSRKYKKTHIIHIREFGDKDFNCIKLTPRYINILNKGSDIFISVSNAVKNYWNSLGIDSNKNICIYDGVDYTNISESSDEDKKKHVLKMVINGGVCEAKRQHLVIEAMKLLPVHILKNITLDIAGWGNQQYIAEILGDAKSCGFESQINYLGSINDVHQRIGSSQIGLMCSRSEGFGLVTAEYMHGRLGVIASDSGASPELIEDEVTGLLFKPGDAKSLADCIIKLYNDRDLLIRISIAAQKKARAMFTQEKNAQSVCDLYKVLLNLKN